MFAFSKNQERRSNFEKMDKILGPKFSIASTKTQSCLRKSSRFHFRFETINNSRLRQPLIQHCQHFRPLIPKISSRSLSCEEKVVRTMLYIDQGEQIPIPFHSFFLPTMAERELLLLLFVCLFFFFTCFSLSSYQLFSMNALNSDYQQNYITNRLSVKSKTIS